MSDNGIEDDCLDDELDGIEEDLEESNALELLEGDVNENDDFLVDDILLQNFMKNKTANAKSVSKVTQSLNVEPIDTVLEKLVDTSSKSYLTEPYMTKYEYSRIRGFRLSQLVKGSVSFAKFPGENPNPSPSEIFQYELNQGVVPVIVPRLLPDGSVEYWKVCDLSHRYITLCPT
jgi:hypothetical protein